MTIAKTTGLLRYRSTTDLEHELTDLEHELEKATGGRVLYLTDRIRKIERILAYRDITTQIKTLGGKSMNNDAMVEKLMNLLNPESEGEKKNLLKMLGELLGVSEKRLAKLATVSKDDNEKFWQSVETLKELLVELDQRITALEEKARQGQEKRQAVFDRIARLPKTHRHPLSGMMGGQTARYHDRTNGDPDYQNLLRLLE